MSNPNRKVAPEADPQFRWQGVRTDYPRDGNAADVARRARFATARETAVANPAPENAAMLARGWGVPIQLVTRLLALENYGATSETLQRIVGIENQVLAITELLETLQKAVFADIEPRLNFQKQQIESLGVELDARKPTKDGLLTRLSIQVENLQAAVLKLQNPKV